MANKNFTDFNLKTPPANNDFLIGYNASGSTEIRTTVGALVSSYSTSTALNAASSVLLRTSVYQSASGSFATTTDLNAASGVLLRTSIYSAASGSFATSTALNAASGVLLRTSIYSAASGNWQSTYSLVNTNSSNWQASYDYVNQNYENWDGVYTQVRDVSSSWSVDLTPYATKSFADSKYLPLSATGVRYTNLTATNVFITNLTATNVTTVQNTIVQQSEISANNAFFQNVTAGNIFADTVNTTRPQTNYEGFRKDLSISNGTTVSQERLGRLTMLTVSNGGSTSVLNLSETASNKFSEGDVVGIWARNGFVLTVTYTPFGGSPTTVATFTGSGSYNSGSIALQYRKGTFAVQGFNDQNIRAIASEMRVESIQPNDPGEPFSTIGRGSFVHGLTLNAGHPKFTNGSDHFHLIQNGTGGNWQTLNGGYNWTTQRITQHTLAFRGSEISTNIVAAYGASLTANQIQAPYGVIPEVSNNYLAIWTSANDASLTVGKIAYFSVSPAGPENDSLRKIGFTAASYPAKIISTNAIGSAESNADIPSGQTLPVNAARHFRIQPFNLSTDNWLGAALVPSGASSVYRPSLALPFTNSVTNTGEVLRLPGDALLAPDSQSSVLSSRGGYNRVSMQNGCELVFDLTNTPLLSSRLPFLYEGLPIIVLLSNSNDLSAVNYGGLTPNSAKCQYGLPVNTTVGSPEIGEFTGSFSNYSQQTYDGYIYRSTPTQVIIRLGQQRGTEESRVQKFAAPNVEYFLDRPNIGINPATFAKSLPPGGLTAVDLNGYRLTGVTPNNRFGSWFNCNTGAVYTLPPIMKGGIEFTSFPPISSSDLQLIVYAGNKDPVHRPVAGMQLFSYERYPNIQPELKETGSVVSKFALGPSCEGFDRDTAVVGFGSTAYHYRSMAIGHRVETNSDEQITIGVDQNVLRVTLSGLSVSSPMLSSNGVDTFLKIKQDNGSMYGLKLQLL